MSNSLKRDVINAVGKDKYIQHCKEQGNDNKATWIENKSGFNVFCNDNYKCSNCGNHEKFATFFCSHCGKEMTSDKEIYWKNWR